MSVVTETRTWREVTDAACPTCMFPVRDHRDDETCEECMFGDGHACYCHEGRFVGYRRRWAPHGTKARWLQGCRCVDCREAANAANRAYKAAVRARREAGR